MAYKKIQIKRGTKNGMPNLRSGEPGFTQDEHSFYIGTGATNKRFLNEEQTKVELDKKVMKTIYDEKINGIDLKNNNQDSEIQLIKNKNIEQDNKLIQLEEKNIELDTNLDNKVKLDGESKSNFNFIGNKVVQDGLVSSYHYETGRNITYTDFISVPNTSKVFTMAIKCKVKESNTTITPIVSLPSKDVTNGYIGFAKATKTVNCNYIGPVNFTLANGNTTDYNGNKVIIISVDTVSGKILYIDEKTQRYVTGVNLYELYTSVRPLHGISQAYMSDTNLLYDFLLYNRTLTPQEIQHNFSVLNNPQSISHLETTSADGTKVKHLFNSNAQVVSMRDERTLNEFANEVLDWEEKTAVGGKIEVGNCKRAWLRNFSIEGNTVKNLQKDNYVISSNNKTFHLDKLIDELQIKPASKYTLVIPNKHKLIKRAYFLQGVATTLSFEENNNYIVFTTKADVTGLSGYLHFYTDITPTSEELAEILKTKVLLLEGDLSTHANTIQPIPFGLSSTQAIISNGGMKSVFEMVNEEGVKEVIELGGTSTKKDKLELLDDGSGIITYNTSDSEDGSSRVDLATPITTYIPKELIPTIATHQTNNLFVDSPVQPSSFKATVPVDKVAVLEKELARIASIVDTPKNVTLLDNYVEDEYNKNQKENQTIEGVM